MENDPVIQFGALSDKLSEQLARQGLDVVDRDELSRIQKIADAVAIVTIHQLMTPSASDRARSKLAKRLWKIVCRVAEPPSEAA